MAWPRVVADYIAAVKARGLVFIPQLPANTNLGTAVYRAPGARTVPAPGQRPRYELAPVGVRVALNWIETKENAAAIPGRAVIALEEAAEAAGLDHGAVGVLAKVLGLPLWLCVVVLVFLGYAVLRQYGVVPSLSSVVKE